MPGALIVHGGAGLLEPARHAAALAGTTRAAERGQAVLAAGGSALDAVEVAVMALEADAAFNAGTGSVLCEDGEVEVDAAIMDGPTRRIGAVGAVPDLGHAIRLARAVLDEGRHVLLVGAEAWRLGRAIGLAPAEPGALVTERARARLAEVLAARRRTGMAGDGGANDGGTVGAVAVDAAGRTAAATSTGGIVGKRRGRVGDTPIVGAGTWAEPDLALSATGDGEAILRVTLTRQIGWRAGEAGLGPAMAAALADLDLLTGGTAGVIGVDRAGACWAATTTPTMAIAWAAAGVVRAKVLTAAAGAARCDG